MIVTWLSPWYFEYIGPLIDAYYADDLPAAQSAYARASASLAEEPRLDHRKAMWLRLQNAWVFVLFEIGHKVDALVAYKKLCSNWGSRQPGPESLEMSRIVQLLTRLHLDVLKFRGVSPMALRALMTGVPDNRRGANFWHYVSTWAFIHRKPELMEGAYGYFATEKPIHYADWFFYRLALMRRLLQGSATTADLKEVLMRAETVAHLVDLRRTILPACANAGLCTGEVNILLDYTARKLGVE